MFFQENTFIVEEKNLVIIFWLNNASFPLEDQADFVEDVHPKISEMESLIKTVVVLLRKPAEAVSMDHFIKKIKKITVSSFAKHYRPDGREGNILKSHL